MDSKSYTVSYNLSPVTLRAYDTNNDHDNNYNDNDERIKTDDVLWTVAPSSLCELQLCLAA